MSQIDGIRLVQRLMSRHPDDLEILSAEIGDHTGELYPAEAQAIASAVHKRRHEFSTGRWLARQALSRLGLPPAPIPIGRMREPLWPAPAVASLSHSGPTCVVAMGTADVFEGVGIDLELGDASDVDAERSILADCESSDFDSPMLLRLAFSAKEAVFKCLFAKHRQFVDYPEVAITIDPAARTFKAVALSVRLRALRLELGHGLYETDEAGALTLFTRARRDGA